MAHIGFIPPATKDFDGSSAGFQYIGEPGESGVGAGVGDELSPVRGIILASAIGTAGWALLLAPWFM